MIEEFDVRRSLSVSNVLGSDVLRAIDRVALERAAQELKGRYHLVGLDVFLFTSDVDNVVRREAQISISYEYLRIDVVAGDDLSVRRIDLSVRYEKLGLAVIGAKSVKGVYPELSHERISESVGRIKAGLEPLLKKYEPPSSAHAVFDEFSCQG